MIRNLERKVIYTVYFLLIAWAVIFVSRVMAWELKTEGYKTRLTKQCAACLSDFAGCMKLVDDYPDQDRDPKEYVASKLACVKFAEKCGIDNQCKTRVVRDEK